MLLVYCNCPRCWMTDCLLTRSYKRLLTHSFWQAARFKCLVSFWLCRSQNFLAMMTLVSFRGSGLTSTFHDDFAHLQNTDLYLSHTNLQWHNLLILFIYFFFCDSFCQLLRQDQHLVMMQPQCCDAYLGWRGRRAPEWGHTPPGTRVTQPWRAGRVRTSHHQPR